MNIGSKILWILGFIFAISVTSLLRQQRGGGLSKYSTSRDALPTEALKTSESMNTSKENTLPTIPRTETSTNVTDILPKERIETSEPINMTAKENALSTIPTNETSTIVTDILPKEALETSEPINITVKENTVPTIPRNENSTIATDIIRIWHDPDSRSVCVHLKEDARCPYPALLGRLSGPALAILDWKEMEAKAGTAGTVVCGDYSNKWLDAGEYFVEIIVLYCEDFGVGAIQRINNETAWLGAGLATRCVEDVMSNRITSKTENTLEISSPTEGSGNYRIGRWVRRKGLPLRPLFTRFQPWECFNSPNSSNREMCIEAIYRDVPGRYLWRDYQGKDIRGLPEYEFQWGLNLTESELLTRLRQRLNDSSTSLPKICAVGDSHSRYMTKHTLPFLNLTGMFTYIRSNWPDPNNIARRLKGENCDKLFVQVGQWPASFYANPPFSFGTYYDKVKLHVQNILKTLENNPNGMVYLPTLDQGPLMGRIDNCSDWRTPTMMDGYSFVNQMIEKELNTTRVKYVDINFIIYPLWDGHVDWQHLLDDARYRKTIYMTALMLGELDGLDLD
mmetsp:Transcript_17412/g.42676  ORF Transcript_17412/g.42676 Transcript_17412/m.42676 type:complete len:565 (+) Transcript_17412:74-1768(+)